MKRILKYILAIIGVITLIGGSLYGYAIWVEYRQHDFTRYQNLIEPFQKSVGATYWEGLPHFREFELYRSEHQKYANLIKIADHEFYPKSQHLSALEWQNLKTYLLDPTHYSAKDPFSMKACGGYHPDFSFSVNHKGQPLYFNICLGCSEGKITTGSKTLLYLNASYKRPNSSISLVLKKVANLRKCRPMSPSFARRLFSSSPKKYQTYRHCLFLDQIVQHLRGNEKWTFGSTITTQSKELHSSITSAVSKLILDPDYEDLLYRENLPLLLLDSWGNPFIICVSDEKPFSLQNPKPCFHRHLYTFSAGPDGLHGTPETDADNITASP